MLSLPSSCVERLLPFIITRSDRLFPQIPIPIVKTRAFVVRAAGIFITVLCQIVQLICFHVIAMQHVLSFPPRRPAVSRRTPQTPTVAPPMVVELPAPSPLHAQPGLEAREAVGGDSVDFVVGSAAVAGGYAGVYAVGIFAGEVEKVDACEDCEEAAEEGDGIYGVGGVEATEEDEGGGQGEGCEGYVVEWVDAVGFC